MIPRRTLGAVVIAVLPLVAGCGAGRDSTTDKEHATPYIASVSAGSMFVTAAALIPSESETESASASATPTPTPSETASPSSSSDTSSAQAYLVATIANRGQQPDTLTGVTVQGATVTPADQSATGLTVQPQQTLRFGNPDLGESANTLAVSGFTQPVAVGTAVQVTFQFQDAGSATLEVPVHAADTYGTTATSTPLPLTGSYPSLEATPEEKASPEQSEPSSG
ncbi:MAG TPA: hypothetical protein VFJ98_08045 [Mycobacteriales bacterium]|nr:hypothetical protein [Mycobacteriales bacterium]